MALFATPAEHAANPPETWKAVKRLERKWHLTTADGTVLDGFTTRGDALEATLSGPLVRLYEQERRWYAGEPVAGWKPYAAPVSS